MSFRLYGLLSTLLLQVSIPELTKTYLKEETEDLDLETVTVNIE